MNKIEPRHGNIEQIENNQKRGGDNGGKKGKGLDKEHV